MQLENLRLHSEINIITCEKNEYEYKYIGVSIVHVKLIGQDGAYNLYNAHKTECYLPLQTQKWLTA